MATCCKRNQEYHRCKECGQGGCGECLPLRECRVCQEYVCGGCLAPLRCEECGTAPCLSCDSTKQVEGVCLCREHAMLAIPARPLTRELCWTAALEAGNAHMAKAGRARWTDEDYSAACVEFDRLWPAEAA